MSKPKLTIVDEPDGKVLAYRNKTSIELFHQTKEVGFNDFSYSWEEIIAIGKKLTNIKKNLAKVS